MLVIDRVGQTWFFGRSRERAGGGTYYMRRWHRSTVCPEVVVRQGWPTQDWSSWLREKYV